MPKIVDHEERRERIAEATWRVIMSRGMEGATVRNIAAEAGLSLGALRHYFTTQEELLAYAMKLVKEKATARIEAIARLELPPKEKMVRILLEMVPVNETTTAEMEVWLAFTFYNRHKMDALDASPDGVYEGMQKMLRMLSAHGLLRADIDVDVETETLYALVDGIALHALLQPARMTKSRVERVLTRYLDAILIE
ncbi:TetR/AcrR family transcriptional regulator [Paenibacillus sp. TRM 82003]|nr:TetR/AcrR family transcriptional regulator [Paenibacillus sp. TRM 82003]